MPSRTNVGTFPDPYLQPTLSVERAGFLLGLGRTQAYAAARRGEIPTLRIGRRLLVPTAVLARHLGLYNGASVADAVEPTPDGVT